MSVITDASTPLTLNSLSNLDIINKINSNTQLFVSYIGLSNVLIPYSSSNYIISILLQTAINTKQPILTGSTSLLGDGAAITNLAYANISGTDGREHTKRVGQFGLPSQIFILYIWGYIICF